MVRTNRSGARELAKSRAEFKAQNIVGKWFDVRSQSIRPGELPRKYLEELKADIETEKQNGIGRMYVIFSYDTPIGWNSDVIGWKKPDHRYSHTTTRHQSVVPGD